MSELEHRPESSHGFASDLSAVVIPAGSPDLLTWLREQIDTDDKLADQMDLITTAHTRQSVNINAGPWRGTRLCLDGQQLRREVEAKRRIIDEHRPVTFTDVSLGIRDAQVCFVCHGGLIPDDLDDLGDDPVLTVQLAYPCPTVRALFPIYADRPGYREEWRP